MCIESKLLFTSTIIEYQKYFIMLSLTYVLWAIQIWLNYC